MANDPLPAILVIGAGVGFYLWSRGELGGLGLGRPAAPSVPAGPRPLFPGSETIAEEQLIGQGVSPAPTGAVVSGAMARATGAAGLAATAGLSGGLVAATAGIGAAALILSWAIVDKGLFRGGEEGVRVNPARDEFFNAFVQHYYPGAGVERQYDAFQAATIQAGFRGDEAEALFKIIFAADTMDEWRRAVEQVRAAFQAKGVNV